MPTKDRIKIFGIGFLIGCVIASFFIMRKAAQRESVLDPDNLPHPAMEAVPMVLSAYADRGVSMESNLITEERSLPPNEEGIYRRQILVTGKQPGQSLLIEETLRPLPSGHNRLLSVRVMASDRMVVTLTPDTEPHTLAAMLRQHEIRILQRGDGERQLIFEIPGERVTSLDESLEIARGLPTLVESAEPFFLDEAYIELQSGH